MLMRGALLSLLLALALSGCGAAAQPAEEAAASALPASPEPAAEEAVEAAATVPCAGWGASHGGTWTPYRSASVRELSRSVTTVQSETGAAYERTELLYELRQPRAETACQISLASGFGQYTLTVHDESGALLQTFSGSDGGAVRESVGFLDANLDGWADLEVCAMGTLNDTYFLYVWDPESGAFAEVRPEGEPLHYYEVYGGYLKTWGRDSYDTTTIRKLVWQGNALVTEWTETVHPEG